MWRMAQSKWLIVQVLLGVPLVIAPVFLKGTISLAVTIPVYVIIVAIMQLREKIHRKRTEKGGLVAQLLAVVSHLQKLTQGGHGASVCAILSDLLANGEFRAQMQFTGNSQAGDLLSNKSERLFSDVGDLCNRVEHCTDGTSDEEIKEVVEELRRLIINYRSIVDDFLRFLSDTKAEKGVPVQKSELFAFRVHDSLADDYDRLMDDARQLGIQLKSILGIEFLDDHHFTRFRRVTLLR